MAPLRSAIISGMNFIFLSLSRPAGRDKLIFTQRPKRIAAIGGTLSEGALSVLTGRWQKAPPFGGAGIEQSEMTERVSHPRAGTALLIRVKLQKLISLKRSYFKLFFCPKWSIMRP